MGLADIKARIAAAEQAAGRAAGSVTLIAVSKVQPDARVMAAIGPLLHGLDTIVLGIGLVHFGVVVVVNMMIGLIHPPFGMLLFVTKALTGIPIGDMMREGWLFLVMLLGLLVAITVFPQIVLWLPQTMGYGTPVGT